MTSTQSNSPRGAVLNIFCENGIQTTAICRKNDISAAAISLLLVNIPILKSDSVALRQLKEWNSWLHDRTIKAAVRAFSNPSFSINSTRTNASKLQKAMNDPCINIVMAPFLVSTPSFFGRGRRFITP
ncbi:MAG: hypothetical protein NT033_01185, partial [Candidatus Omnitrophica bacterium]|nr:hypothetical protein [Candidatus Omnitrophota bacterium]